MAMNNQTHDDDATADHQSQRKSMRVMVTGASGFVGRHITLELIRRGHTPVCLLREPGRLLRRIPHQAQSRIEIVSGKLSSQSAVETALDRADAVIHLVGIILESMRQSFHRVNVEGTRTIVDAAVRAGVDRYIHMSALGTRPHAISRYHQTKHAAECLVKNSGLNWTIFRPSIIHGPDGEFMQLMKAFVKPKLRHGPILAMPYFGTGQGTIQPISVNDIAHCFVKCIQMPDAIGQTYAMAGHEVYTWKELYALCSRAIRGDVKRQVSVPIPLAYLMAMTIMKTPLVPKLLRFNRGQVQMAQEQCTCDPSAAESAFGLTFRSFRDELLCYTDQIN